MNIVRACYVVNTKDDINKGGRNSTFLNNRINKEWNDTYLQDFNKGLLNKEGLGNIITFDAKSFVSDVKNYLMYGLRDHFDVKNYLTYGLRDHFVNLIKNVFIVNRYFLFH